MHVAPRVADFLLYLFGCGLLMLAGVGILRLLRVPIDRASSMLFGPAVAQAAWAIFLGAGVTLAQPVRVLAGPLWLFTLVCAALGWYNLQRGDAAGSDASPQWSDRAWPLVAFCTVLPILVLLPYFAFGITEYAGSRHPDAWSYAALGQSLWTLPAGQSDGSSPLYQYASNLIFGRIVGSSELGLVSVLLRPGDTQAASGLFLALAFFTFASACATFARTMRMRSEQAIVFLLLAVTSGWSLNALLISNFDNILSLFYFPALAVVASPRRPAGRSWWILGGVFLAALLYTYPEMGVLVCAPAAVMFGERLWRKSWYRETWQVVLGVAVVLCLLFPFAEHLAAYFRMQVGSGLQPEGVRPGGRSFETLADPKLGSPAFWALGEELTQQEFGLQAVCAGRKE